MTLSKPLNYDAVAMNITREEAVAKIESWRAVNANLQLFVKDIHGQGFRQHVFISEASLDFVKLDIGGGDWINLALENAHFALYSHPEQPPPQLLMMPPAVPFVLVITKGIMNFVLYEVAE